MESLSSNMRLQVHSIILNDHQLSAARSRKHSSLMNCSEKIVVCNNDCFFTHTIFNLLLCTSVVQFFVKGLKKSFEYFYVYPSPAYVEQLLSVSLHSKHCSAYGWVLYTF
jgi:hypothetical protein